MRTQFSTHGGSASLPWLFPVSVASLLLVACSAPVATSSEIACAEFERSAPPVSVARSIDEPAGARFTVAVCANPTTGFMWGASRIDDMTVVREVERRYEPPNQQVAGASGQQIVIFESLHSGTTRIALDYSQPWSGGVKATWQLTLAVRVS